MSNGVARGTLRVETALNGLADGRPARFLYRLEKQTGLQMPMGRYATAGRIGGIAFMIGLVGGIVLAVNGQWWAGLWFLLLLAAGIGLISINKGRWPTGITTFGDLAARVAALNHMQLGQARDLPDSVWQRLTAIVAEQSDMPPQEMRADTLLFAPRKQLKTG